MSASGGNLPTSRFGAWAWLWLTLAIIVLDQWTKWLITSNFVEY